jgi:pimeloyl-ACP methyl ester carboxylesterase
MQLGQRLVLKYIKTKFRILSSISKRKAAEKAFALFCTPQHRNKKRLPPVFEKAEKLQFSFVGQTVRGYKWTPQGATKKALIVHGFESSVINFDRYVKPLMQKGYEVLAFDAPAHGRSSGKTITAVIYKDLMVHIYQHYGPIDSFISHSFGGLCLSLALETLPHNEDHKLVLVAPAVETTTAIDNFFRFIELDDAVRMEFDKLIMELGGQPPEWYSLARAAQNIKAQVLFLQDKDDHMTPISDVEPIMKRKYPNFHFIITEGLGHRRIYRDNKISRSILEFL